MPIRIVPPSLLPSRRVETKNAYFKRIALFVAGIIALSVGAAILRRQLQAHQKVGLGLVIGGGSLVAAALCLRQVRNKIVIKVVARTQKVVYEGEPVRTEHIPVARPVVEDEPPPPYQEGNQASAPNISPETEERNRQSVLLGLAPKTNPFGDGKTYLLGIINSVQVPINGVQPNPKQVFHKMLYDRIVGEANPESRKNHRKEMANILPNGQTEQDVEWFFWLASDAYKYDEYNEAVVYLEKIFAHFALSRKEECYFQLAADLYRLGKSAKSIEMLDKIYSHTNKLRKEEWFLQLATDHFHHGEREKAVEMLQKIYDHRMKQKKHDLLYKIAQSYVKEGNIRKAQEITNSIH